MRPDPYAWTSHPEAVLGLVAVEAARRAGLPLKLAGKNAEPGEQAYFAEHVEPHLGGDIEFVGEVAHGDKIELLRNARAMLMPIDWEEPFGLVMIEAMACGTPVLASRRGSVPEVIDDGVTGIIVDDWSAVADALARAEALDPQAMRAAVEQRFSPQGMVADYLVAYDAVMAARP